MRKRTSFFKELKNLPDRVVGILATTIIDERLEHALKAHFYDVKYDGQMLFDKMFNYSAILGSFGARIDVGFAIGIYGEDAFRDLHTIRKIRNQFAHKLAPKDFKIQSVADLAANLKIPSNYPIIGKGGVSSTGENPSQFQIAKTMLAHSSVTDLTDPRSRFIRAAELLSGFLMFSEFWVHGTDPTKTRHVPEF